jgi:hypothetical protein
VLHGKSFRWWDWEVGERTLLKVNRNPAGVNGFNEGLRIEFLCGTAFRG